MFLPEWEEVVGVEATGGSSKNRRQFGGELGRCIVALPRELAVCVLCY
jgi:hypothetical protein